VLQGLEELQKPYKQGMASLKRLMILKGLDQMIQFLLHLYQVLQFLLRQRLEYLEVVTQDQ
jgi:hypothetical protein